MYKAKLLCYARTLGGDTGAVIGCNSLCARAIYGNFALYALENLKFNSSN